MKQPPKPKQHKHIVATFTGNSVGLKLGATPDGLRVKELTSTFDREAGRDVAVGDYLLTVNGAEMKGISVDDVVKRIQMTRPPRVMEFLRITELDGKVCRRFLTTVFSLSCVQFCVSR